MTQPSWCQSNLRFAVADAAAGQQVAPVVMLYLEEVRTTRQRQSKGDDGGEVLRGLVFIVVAGYLFHYFLLSPLAAFWSSGRFPEGGLFLFAVE
jgi:hypothetical protein